MYYWCMFQSLDSLFVCVERKAGNGSRSLIQGWGDKQRQNKFDADIVSFILQNNWINVINTACKWSSVVLLIVIILIKSWQIITRDLLTASTNLLKSEIKSVEELGWHNNFILLFVWRFEAVSSFGCGCFYQVPRSSDASVIGSCSSSPSSIHRHSVSFRSDHTGTAPYPDWCHGNRRQGTWRSWKTWRIVMEYTSIERKS